MFDHIRKYYEALAPGLTDADWAAISARFEIIHLKKGDYLVRAGQVCNHVAFVNNGFIRIYLIKDGKESINGFITNNQYISEYTSFLTRQPAIYTIDALEDSELILLHYNDMQELYEQHPVFERVGRKVAEFLFIEFDTHAYIADTLTPEQRYQRLIDKESALLDRVPQYMIASYLGITPEHLSRLRKKMAGK